MRGSASLLALLLSTNCLYAESFPAFYDVRGVAFDDVLNIRSDPTAQAPIIGTIPFDAKRVEAVAEQEAWLSVNTGEQSGWVSARYMERQTGDWFEDGAEYACFGTEPFWSGTNTSESLEISQLNGPSFALPTKNQTSKMYRSGDIELTKLYGVELSGVMLSLRGESCNDGMSDRQYGLSAMLSFIGEGGFFQLQGCCSLR